MRVFLTGGTGLLGSHLARDLGSRGHEIVALYRSSSDTSVLSDAGCTLVEGDVRDAPDVLAGLMQGCTHVVHGAALVYASGGWPRIREANVEGTRNVLEAAHRAGVGHALHVSSVAVYGTTQGEVDEDAPVDSDLLPGDLYARSKREAEDVAREIEARTGLPVTIVRPSAVYGEWDRLMAPTVARILRMPLVPMLGPGDNTLPVVYAGNVAVAMRLALEAGRGGAIFNIGMDHPLTQRQLYDWLGVGLGKRLRVVKVPASLLRSTAAMIARFGMGAPGARHMPVERIVRFALGENPYPSTRIRAELGWDPPHEHEQALGRTGRWLVGAS